LRWQDVDGKEHTWVMPAHLIEIGVKELIGHLLAGGLHIELNCSDDVVRYVGTQDPDCRVRIAHRTGWVNGNFVLPDETIGSSESTEDVMLYPAVTDHLYRISGTLEEWQHNVGELCRGNSLLLFSICCALSGPTLGLLDEEGGGYHIHGRTSKGKTTTLICGGSVWGGGGKDGFLSSWRATGNALELVAILHNDACLFIDELGKADPRVAIEIPYMLAGGMSKDRMNSDGTARKKETWQLQYLSSGELTLEQIAQSIAKKIRGGMEVRFICVPADPGKGLGAFEDLHGSPDAATFARRVQTEAKRYYGVVGREWLKNLVTAPDQYRDLLRQYVAQFESKYLPTDGSAEVGRVVRRFALLSAAGEVAIILDLVPWEEGEAERGIGRCLEMWLAQRGTGSASGSDSDR
jgi:putative DNA primase/helicase